MTPNQEVIPFPVFGDSATKLVPEAGKYSAGFQESDVLPAEWVNYFFNKASAAVTALNPVVNSAQRELNYLLTQAGIEPSAASTQQVYAAIKSFVQNTANLVVSDSAVNVQPSGTDSGVVNSLYSKLKITVLLKNGFYGADEDTKMTFNYKNLGAKKLYIVKNGTLIFLPSTKINLDTTERSWFCQAYTKYDLEYDATLDDGNGGWIVLNNPDTISSQSGGFIIYATGEKVDTSNKVTSKIFAAGATLMLEGGNITTTTKEYNVTVENLKELTDGFTTRIYFKGALQSSAAITAVSLNINNLGAKEIKASRSNALVNVASHEMTAGANFNSEYNHRWCDKGVRMELTYDADNDCFVVDGDTEVMSWESENAGYKIKTNGFIEQFGNTYARGVGISIDFFIKFNNYPFLILNINDPAINADNRNFGYDITQNNFKFTRDSNYRKVWYASGY